MGRYEMVLSAIWLCLIFSIAAGDEPRINQIQLIGTHNSYHRVSKFVQETSEFLEGLELLNYELPPLKEQLDAGIRAFELDLHYHTAYGWLVLHIPKVDPETHCKNLKECLLEFKRWSDEHPKHIPIFIILDLTNEFIIWEGFKVPTLRELSELESILLEVFGIDKIITPDSVRGNYNTLEEAVQNNNWVKLSESRGKFLFIFHNRWRLREIYTGGDKSLKGKLMFVNSRPGEGYSSIIIDVNPSEDVMPSLVKKGYFVITFGCDPKLVSIHKCEQLNKRAFSSGAQIIETDYFTSFPHPQTGYYLAFPEGSTFRWNPVVGPSSAPPLSE